MRKHLKFLFILIVLTAVAMIAEVSTTNAQEFQYSRDLSLGASGPDVTNLQTWLIENGYDIPAITSSNSIKGYFGVQTQAALSTYQRSVGIPSFGFFGSITQEKIAKSNSGSALRVTSPNGDEIWQKGIMKQISWNASGNFHDRFDIKILSACATNVVCERTSHVIAEGIYYESRSYDWRVGNIWDATVALCDPTPGSEYGCPSWPVIPDGIYTIQICESITTRCDQSDTYFTITSNVSGNKPPVINGVDAPTTLKMGETGTWAVKATDPKNETLSYNVLWGDENGLDYLGNVIMSSPPALTQSSTFTHSYSHAGTYTVVITVRDSAGLTAQTSSTVTVTGATSNRSDVLVLSPNRGEKLKIGSVHSIAWKLDSKFDPKAKVDIYLGRHIPIVCVTTPCGPIFEKSTYVLDKNISKRGIYNWIVGTDISDKPIPAGNYGVWVCLAGTDNCDSSNALFTITSTTFEST